MTRKYPDEIIDLALKYSESSPPAITLAQWALETGYGRSVLYTKYNNCFGIKFSENAFNADLNKGSTTQATTEFARGEAFAIPQNFARYQSKDQSFRDRVRILSSVLKLPAWSSGRGARAGLILEQLQSYDPIKRVFKGWSTDPQYRHKLRKIIQQDGLEKYDDTAKEKPPARF